MTGAAFYYLLCTSRNRILSRMRRLRQPKYLVSAVAGAAYIYFFFVRSRPGGPGSRIAAGAALGPDAAALLELLFSALLVVLSLAPWILPSLGRAPLFSDAEVQFLFAAPVSRRAVLNFRLLRMQAGILIGIAVFALLFSQARPGGSGLFILATMWIVYSWIGAYRMGVTLSKMSLAEHGISGLRRQAWVLAVVGLVLVLPAVWWRWFGPPPPSFSSGTLEWIVDATSSGPAWLVLLPFRALVRPAFAPDLLSFAARLLPAALVLVLTYLWVIRSDRAFEEASLEQCERTARELERGPVAATRAGGAGRPRRVPFDLAPRGQPHVAIFWKNLISVVRINARQLLLILAAVVLAIVLSVASGGAGREVRLTAIGGISLMFAAILTVLGPTIVRNDLRWDLLHVDMIKSYPIAGWSLVLGEVLAPALILTLLQWILLFAGAATIPELGSWKLSVVDRWTFGLAAGAVLPCLSLVGVIIQNGAALIVPSWVQLGWREKRGIEATGQRLILTSASVLLLVVACIPAALVAGAAFLAAGWFLGRIAIPAGLIAAAGILLIEAGAAVFFLGRLFDRLDVSLEHLTA